MNSLARVVVVLLLVGLMGVEPLLAQSQSQGGPYASLGVGYGNAVVTCDQCGDSNREGSFTGYFELGLHVSDAVLVAIMGNGWLKSVDGQQVNIGLIGLSARFYPVHGTGFFIKGGLGSVYIDAVLNGVDKSTGFSFGWLLAGGYDVPLADTAALTFILGVFGGSPNDIDSQTGVNTNVVSATVGFSVF